MKDFTQSPHITTLTKILGVALIALIIFGAGVSVGFHKNRNPHGTFGEIISIDLPVIVVKGQNDIEKIIRIGTSTNIRKMRGDVSAQNLQIGDRIVVIGNPNDADNSVQASFIRVMPNPFGTSTINKK